MPSRRGADHAAHSFDAGAMAFRARQAARSGPTAIAVKQDGDVNFRIGNDSQVFICAWRSFVKSLLTMFA